MPFNPKIVGARIKECREFAGLLQKDLAEQAGFAPNTISCFETGAKRPSIEAIVRLAEALNISTDYLLGVSKDAISFSHDNVLTLPLNCSDKFREHVLHQIDIAKKANL